MIPSSGPAYLVPPAELSSPRRLIKAERIGLVLGGCVLAMLLAIACFLTPSPQGFGTHRQLGFPSCSMVTLFGIKCPGCGMTTSWAFCMRGDIESALNANIAGAMLCGLSLFCAPIMIGMGIVGRPSRGGWFSIASTACFCAVMGIAMIEWVIRLAASG